MKNRSWRERCYLCGSNTLSQIPGKVRDSDDLVMLICSDCTLTQISSDDHITESHYSDSGMFGKTVPSLPTMLAATSNDDSRRIDQHKNLIINSDLLDVGCGSAGFLIKASQLARSCTGVEPEERIIKQYQDQIDIYPSISSLTKDFDVITMFHVLEHLKDPVGELLLLKEKLKPGGRLVIEVPNSSDALLHIYESRPFQEFTYWSQHLFVFNLQTLAKVLDKASLNIISIEQYQRYPLSNHLYWLSNGMPGGHVKWSFIDSPLLNESYASMLARIGACDTLIAHVTN